MPVASVILVSHRHQLWLAEALRSVLDQTLGDLELLLVDNGAGLDPASWGGAARDPRLRLFRLSHHAGIAAAHNLAVREARGEFVALLDHDDLMHPSRLELQVAALRADPELGLIGSAADTIDARGRIVGREFTLTEPAAHAAFSAYTVPVASPTLTGRREWFFRLPYRPECTLAADFDFQSRANEVTRCAALPDALGAYRVHERQATRERFSEQMLNAALARLVAARRRAGRPEDFVATMREFSAWRERPPPLAETYQAFAARCLTEGFSALAVYHARKWVAAARTPRSAVAAVGLLSAACRASPRAAGFLVHLFLRGPLAAHGLRPLR